MCKRFKVPYEFSARPIEKINIPTKSRDDVPRALRALQHIYITPSLNERIFAIVEKKIMSALNQQPEVSPWEILVFAVVRWLRNANDDHLEHIVNFDSLVRGMVGISDFGEGRKQYSSQMLKTNVSPLDDKTLLEINEIILDTGYCFKKKRKTKP